MANFVHDTFTISGGLTDLATQHVGETGADWTAHPVRVNSPTSFLIAPGRVRMRETNNWFYASGVPASADYDVEADFILLTDIGAENAPAVVGRMDTTAANGYEGRADYTADVYEIRKVVSGVVTTLDSVSTPAWSARTDTIKLEMRGTALKLYVGGVEQLSVTDSDISAAGRAGLQTHGVHGGTTGTHIDNFDADDAAGGDVTAPTLSSASASATGSTTGSGSVSTDEGNGTLYFVVTTSSSAPSAAQVQAGQDHTGAAAADSGSQAVSGTGVQNITGGFSGLSPSTAYYAHYQHQDAATNDSTVASSSSFTTDAAPTGGVPSLVGPGFLIGSGRLVGPGPLFG